MLVSKLFGSTGKGSKLGSDWKDKEFLTNRETRGEITGVLAKVASMGYHPHIDIIDPIKLKNESVGIVPRDLDVGIEIRTDRERAKRLLDSIDYLLMNRYRSEIESPISLQDFARIDGNMKKEASEFAGLFRLAKSNSNPEMQKALNDVLKEHIDVDSTAPKTLRTYIKKQLKDELPHRSIFDFFKPFIRKGSNTK